MKTGSGENPAPPHDGNGNWAMWEVNRQTSWTWLNLSSAHHELGHTSVSLRFLLCEMEMIIPTPQARGGM